MYIFPMFVMLPNWRSQFLGDTFNCNFEFCNLCLYKSNLGDCLHLKLFIPSFTCVYSVSLDLYIVVPKSLAYVFFLFYSLSLFFYPTYSHFSNDHPIPLFNKESSLNKLNPNRFDLWTVLVSKEQTSLVVKIHRKWKSFDYGRKKKFFQNKPSKGNNEIL